MHRFALVFLLGAIAFAADDLRVMSFNVRYPAPSDGPNVWDLRRDIMVKTIADARPDLIGTQELFQLQGDYLVSKLADYAWFGLSRRGNHEDEHMGVFYKKSRLELLESGNFWLSETPDKPGSMSWNISLPRMVTWGEFRDRRTNRRFRFFNTHFPHRREDEQARTECARVLVSRIGALGTSADVILTGDFNTGPDSEAHRVLTEVLRDAHDQVANPQGPIGTFHGFTGKQEGQRIDWILFRGRFKPVSVDTLTDNSGGRYPSDHFPVLAVLAEQP
jgi:endonuclease/exonuclease/phosphatase family metal-dependent hydrolase